MPESNNSWDSDLDDILRSDDENDATAEAAAKPVESPAEAAQEAKPALSFAPRGSLSFAPKPAAAALPNAGVVVPPAKTDALSSVKASTGTPESSSPFSFAPAAKAKPTPRQASASADKPSVGAPASSPQPATRTVPKSSRDHSESDDDDGDDDDVLDLLDDSPKAKPVANQAKPFDMASNKSTASLFAKMPLPERRETKQPKPAVSVRQDDTDDIELPAFMRDSGGGAASNSGGDGDKGKRRRRLVDAIAGQMSDASLGAARKEDPLAFLQTKTPAAVAQREPPKDPLAFLLGKTSNTSPAIPHSTTAAKAPPARSSEGTFW